MTVLFDLLITGGLLIDGTGAPALRGDLAIQDGKIAARGNLTGARAARTIDAAGFCVTPGFLDIHRHADAALFRPGFGECELCQGLTTIVNGNCGMSPFPVSGEYAAAIGAYLQPVTGSFPRAYESFADYAASVPALPLNIGQLAGGGTLRASVAGFSPDLTDEQLRALHARLESALADGVLGVSLGLGYAPECFYTTEQLIDALAPLRGSGIPLTVHMRQEGSGVVAALEEMLTVARALQTPLEISHLKAIGGVNWRVAVPQMLAMMESAREDGVDVACDVYPYTAGSTQLIHVLPPECQTGGLEQLSERLGDAAFRAQLRERMQTGEDFENISLLAGWENIRIAALAGAEDQKYVGQSIAALAEKEGKDPFDALFDLLAREHCAVTMIDEITCEDDLEAILRDGHSSIISDSIYPGSGLCHPRVYGTFVRAIEHYVRERGVLTLEEAVAKMTGLPAGRLGLRTKGKLIPGLDADILLFRPEALHERDSYADPAEFAEGMETVLVAGVPVLEDGAITGAKPGKILKR